jgi:uncharacterized protein YbaP (TraB family)
MIMTSCRRRAGKWILILAWLSSAGTIDRPAPASAYAPGTSAQHFVWRVTNASEPFYLVGSIHNLTTQDYPLPPIYETALAKSKRVVFEFNPHQRDRLERKFREIGRYPAGQDIETVESPRTIALLKKNVWRFGLRFDALRHLRPWAIALRLLSGQGPVGPSTARSMDSYLSMEASRAGKELAGLETVDEHVAFWQQMLERDGENLLLYALTQEAKVGRLFEKTRDAWKRGDLAALSATNARLHRANPGIAQKLLDRRNAQWVTRIEAEIKSGKATTIVAGAGHFSGPHSVIALLRARGYRIQRL